MSVDDSGIAEVTSVEGHAVHANSMTPVGNPNGNDGAVAGTSSDTSIAGPSRLHIQKPRAKRLTDAAKQHQELTTSFISLLQKEQEREFKPDEVDATFAGLANRMSKHFNPDQLEDVLQEINRVVTDAINNVRAGMPAVRAYLPCQPPPLQAVPNIIQTHQGQIQMQQPNQTQHPPAMRAAPNMQPPLASDMQPSEVTQIQAPTSFEYVFDDII